MKHTNILTSYLLAFQALEGCAGKESLLEFHTDDKSLETPKSAQENGTVLASFSFQTTFEEKHLMEN